MKCHCFRLTIARFGLFALFICLSLVLLGVAFAQSSPGTVPEDVKQQGLGVVSTYKGSCKYQKVEYHCLAGVHRDKNYYLLLLFNENGILVRVIREDDGKQRVLWTHPELTV